METANWWPLSVKQLNTRGGTGILRTSLPYTCCPPADLKIWKGILKLLLDLSARTLSKDLLPVCIVIVIPFHPQTTRSITPQPSRKRRAETRVKRWQTGLATQHVPPPHCRTTQGFLLGLCKMAARSFWCLKKVEYASCYSQFYWHPKTRSQRQQSPVGYLETYESRISLQWQLTSEKGSCKSKLFTCLDYYTRLWTTWVWV